MMSVEGHDFAGAIFIIWAMWWAVINAMKLFSQKPTTYPPKLLRPQLVENVVCIILALTGLLFQQFAQGGPGLHLYDEKNHQWVDLKSWHHSTVFLFFLVSSIVGALTHCPLRLPLGLDRLLLSVAMFNEGMLINSHRTAPMGTLQDRHIHSILLIPIFSAAICLLLEVHFRDYPILVLLRISMFLTQGTWFCQIRFLSRSPWGTPIWDPNDPGTAMFLTLCFSWHYLVNIFLLSIIYGTVYCFLNRKRKNKGTNFETEPLKQDCGAYTLLPNECSED
ncbi:PREDICTED: transmembrane protein 45B-like [Gekko japonicus]|uniref:Transmembrane protein 45B n=1 Tax=Gekko japonicus TaxID=146911 RepID=A0ABM1KGD0_GEKJA|nr:PREDICTED: transmembrane protein 45B-like [Gekko japonicus]XP_015272767.1 PREDICTED: transmembrane protein 45B-like [Gekko japonicus]